jgi:hypothetical protein
LIAGFKEAEKHLKGGYGRYLQIPLQVHMGIVQIAEAFLIRLLKS